MDQMKIKNPLTGEDRYVIDDDLHVTDVRKDEDEEDEEEKETHAP